MQLRTGFTSRRGKTAAGLGATVLVLLAFAACTGARDNGVGGLSVGGEADWEGAGGGDGDEEAVGRDDVQDEAAGPGPADDRDAEVASGQAVALGELAAADEARKLVRHGRMTVAYPLGFEDSSREVAALAERLGGGVAAIESDTDEDGVTRGTVTVEVPVDRFDELLTEVSEVGQVLRRDVASDDLTEEHVDLESRLRHLERQEEFYLELFDQADGVDDALSIQRHLEGVQQRKEQVQGRLDQIERITARSTLAVELVPEGDRPGATARAGVGFDAYWHDAVDAFVRVAGTLLVMVVGAIPLLLAGGAALAVVLLAVRLWRRPAVNP